jgi:hypothetical protein
LVVHLNLTAKQAKWDASTLFVKHANKVCAVSASPDYYRGVVEKLVGDALLCCCLEHTHTQFAAGADISPQLFCVGAQSTKGVNLASVAVDCSEALVVVCLSLSSASVENTHGRAVQDANTARGVRVCA